MSKSWSEIAKEKCTCKNEDEICPAHYELLMSTHTQQLSIYASNISAITKKIEQIEAQRKKYLVNRGQGNSVIQMK